MAQMCEAIKRISDRILVSGQWSFTVEQNWSHSLQWKVKITWKKTAVWFKYWQLTSVMTIHKITQEIYPTQHIFNGHCPDLSGLASSQQKETFGHCWSDIFADPLRQQTLSQHWQQMCIITSVRNVSCDFHICHVSWADSPTDSNINLCTLHTYFIPFNPSHSRPNRLLQSNRKNNFHMSICYAIFYNVETAHYWRST